MIIISRPALKIFLSHYYNYCRQIDEMKLEQALQRNPRKNAVTLATTGAAIISSYKTMKVISSIRVFNEEDIVPAQTYL